MIDIVFATNNVNKLKEVKATLPKNIKLLSLNDIGCYDEIPETQPTIAGNAKQKADYIKTHYGYNCFADDTGLEVDALHGEPGVLSARYAGLQKSDDDNINKLLNALKHNTNRNAQFKTIIALHFNGRYLEFTGICKGQITKEKRGDKGFGYDPIFQPNGYNKTFAEIDLELKNNISHRGIAIKQLIAFFKNTKT